MDDIKRIMSHYDLSSDCIKKINTGSSGNVYLIESKGEKYVLKETVANQMNHPELEPSICESLLANGINTLHYKKTTRGNFSFKNNDSIINVYKYIEGTVPSYNSLDDHIVDECASLLAKINLSLNDMDLPLGISQDFFKFMTPANAYKSYTKSLTKALDNNEMLIIENIKKRIELLEYIKDWEFDTKRLSYYNSHGDFTTNQLVINDKINIIDFTSACKQPIIWEITRFFFHADKSALNGKLNINRFNKYLEKYTDVLKLNEYDLKNIFKLYFYQILVCDYYSQYYKESNENKKLDYLNQANFASKIIFSNEKLIKNMS